MPENKNKRVTIGQGADAFFGPVDEKEESQKEHLPEKNNAPIPENTQTTKPQSEQTTKPEKIKYAKVGYRVSQADSDTMEEMRLKLRRRLGRKVYYEEMLAVMIEYAQHDLEAFGDESFLVKALKQMPEK